MRTVIELDCGDIPPECGFTCGACLQEIREVLEAMDGVLGFAQHLDSRIEIEHDPNRVSPQDLLEAISKLPTQHEGVFTPTLEGPAAGREDSSHPSRAAGIDKPENDGGS